jgi:hypothetical protein
MAFSVRSSQGRAAAKEGFNSLAGRVKAGHHDRDVILAAGLIRLVNQESARLPRIAFAAEDAGNPLVADVVR